MVSTPYHHAAEIIAPGNGILAAPGDPANFATAVNRLLGDEELRRGMAKSAYALGRAMIWRSNVEAAMAEFAACAASDFAPPSTASPSFEHAEACG